MMGLFKHKDGGFFDVIRCDEPSYLIWKWHPKVSLPGNNSRENAIRWGSSLRVKDGEVAIFAYSNPNGYIYDAFVGPCDAKLSTKNLPVLANLIGALYGGDSPFQAEVYFINLARIIQVKFWVPFFDVYDPRFLDFGILHTPDQQLHLHGILAPPSRKGAPLHESKERDLYNWRSTGNCDYINWRSHHAKLSGDLETG